MGKIICGDSLRSRQWQQLSSQFRVSKDTCPEISRHDMALTASGSRDRDNYWCKVRKVHNQRALCDSFPFFWIKSHPPPPPPTRSGTRLRFTRRLYFLRSAAFIASLFRLSVFTRSTLCRVTPLIRDDIS